MRPLALLLCLLLPACGSIQNFSAQATRKRQEKELKKLAESATSEVSDRLGERAVGEVVLVNEKDGYALVQARSGLPLSPGQELECRGTGNGRLKVTPERNSTFCYAADILSGAPQKGDAVVAVKSNAKAGPRLIPIAATAPAGSYTPANTLNMDPSSIRPEDLPKTDLGDPNTAPPAYTPPPPQPRSVQPEPGNLLLPPPQSPQEPALPQ